MTNDSTLVYVRVYIFSRYTYLIVFGMGFVGNSLNFMVFFRKKFRSHPCSVYLIAYSLNNYLVLIIGLLVWSLINGFFVPLDNDIIIWCKIRRYFAHVTYLFASCLLTAASVNRYASVREAQFTESHHYFVFLCRHRTTFIIIALLLVFCLLINLHVPFLFEIDQHMCYAQHGLYRIFYDIFALIFYGLCPVIILVVVNIATVIYIRSIRRLVHPTVSRREFRLTGLIIAHSTFDAVLTLPYIIDKFVYYTYKGTPPTEAAKLATAITLLANYANHCFSFYLYTVTTRSFRRELWRTFSSCMMRMTCKSSRK